jgi:AcrR family transcriptional regulator
MPPRLAIVERPAPTRKSEMTREAILSSAARVFREQGYSGAKLSDIAAGADMKAGSLYYHFTSREALVEAVMARGVDTTHRAVVAGLAALPRSADALERLKLAIRTHLLLLLEQEDIASATIKLIWQVPQDVRERVLAQQRAYGAVWKTLLKEARAANLIRADLDLSIVRMGIMGALNWTADWYRPARMTPEQIAHDMTEMVIGGLAK